MTALPAPPSLLVGRDRELATLRERLVATCAGHGGLVLIGGEAGIGKTALAETVCREAATAGTLVLAGHCYDLSETPPYGPWVELFGRYSQADGMPPLPAAFARRGTIGQVASQAELFQEVADFLAAVTKHRPLVLLLEDLHWADPASLDLLRSVGRTLSDHSMLVLALYRVDEITHRHPLFSWLPLLVRESAADRLEVPRLSYDAIRALVATRYRLSYADDSRLVGYLDARAEGNALFVGELLRALEEQGTLQRDSEGWAFRDTSQVRVPSLIKQVIGGRVARLGEDARRLLGVAAVIGQEVPLDLWAAIGGVDEETLSAVVERAAEAHVIEETPDGARARFAHALIRETLYEEILPSRRRRLHRQVAEALERLSHPDFDALAYHYRQAGDGRAVAWLMRAGDHAWQSRALTAARERYQAALVLTELGAAEDGTRGWLLYRLIQVEHMEPSRIHNDYLNDASAIATVTADPVFAAAFLFTRGYIDFNMSSVRQGLREMEAGVAAIDALAPTDRNRFDTLVREHVVNTSNTPRTTLILHLAIVGRFADAIAMTHALEAHAGEARQGDPVAGIAYSDAHLGLAMAHAHLGRVLDAQVAFVRSREAYRSANLETRQVALEILLELILITLPYQTDDIKQRRHLATRADAVYRRDAELAGSEIPSALTLPLLLVEGPWEAAWAIGESTIPTMHGGHPNIMSRPSWAWLARERGEPAVAWDQIGVVLPAGTATEPGDIAYVLAVAMILLAATLCLDTGDLPNAEAWLKLHGDFLALSGAVLGRSEGQALQSRYWRQAGDMGQAHEHAARALAHATAPRQPLALLAAHRLLGELDTDAGRYERAADHLDEAFRLADACAAPYERALTLLALADLHARQRRPDDAARALAEVRAICTLLGAKPALARADALAARLEAAKAITPAYPAGLSEREVEVLRLVAAGRSNQEIADALFLSAHTVRHHLTHILAKTDASNRAEAVAFALRQGLA